MTTRRFEPLGGAIMGVTIDEDGFASVHVVHSACSGSMEYASGPLDTASGEIECELCGEMLLKYVGGLDEEVPDASSLF